MCLITQYKMKCGFPNSRILQWDTESHPTKWSRHSWRTVHFVPSAALEKCPVKSRSCLHLCIWVKRHHASPHLHNLDVRSALLPH